MKHPFTASEPAREQAGNHYRANPLLGRWVEVVECISTHNRAMRRNLGEHLASYEITEAQFSILWACGQESEAGVSQTALAHQLSVSQSHVSGQVDQLRDRGLLVSRRAMHDRRLQLWNLSQAGNELLRQLLSSLSQVAENHISFSSTDWRASLASTTALCQQIINALDGSEVANSQSPAALLGDANSQYGNMTVGAVT